MPRRVAIVYNEPNPSRYDRTHEEKAVLGVLEAVAAVHRSLLEMGDAVTLLPLLPPFETARRELAALEVEVVFNLFEGFCGEPETEALVPEALEELGLPYTGCRAGVLRLALDKPRVKVMMQAAGIITPDFQLINPGTLPSFHLKYPCVVKPSGEDASHGITADSFVDDFQALERQVKTVTESYGKDALVEEFVGGREFNATVMGNSRYAVLPVSEIVYTLPPGIPRILTFAAKWDTGSPYYYHTKVACPAEITGREREYIAGTAMAAFRLLRCRGYARVDMRLDEKGKLNVFEVNPNPDISPDTGAARQAEAAGMTYTEFVRKIVKFALEPKKDGRQSPPDDRRRQAGADADAEKYARI